MQSKSEINQPIAIVGISSLFPGSSNNSEFWHNILNGKDLLTDIPHNHWSVDEYYSSNPTSSSTVYVKRGGFIPEIDFDPIEFGIPPSELSLIDSVQLLSLVLAKRVLLDTNSVQTNKVDRKNISVILGLFSITELIVQMSGKIQHPSWRKVLKSHGLPDSEIENICMEISNTFPKWEEATTPGLLGNVVAGRIANRLDLGGTNCVIDAACASSLSAINIAIQELRLGYTDLVITGGADAVYGGGIFLDQ